MTATANTAFTAAQFNTHVRDNLNETAPAKATTAGRIFVATGANAIAERDIPNAEIATVQTTASTSFVDLATSGPAVTLTTGTEAIVFLYVRVSNNTTGSLSSMGYDVSGATTLSAAVARSVSYQSSVGNDLVRCSAVIFESALTAGSNTFTSKYSVTSGTGSFGERRMFVIGL